MADGELWGYEQDLLAQCGLAWEEPAALAAASLFKPANLKSAAAVMASQHPRALDYIRQAPILVPASRIATKQRGKGPWRDELKMWAHRVSMAPKLRDLMRLYNVAVQFRTLDSRILTQPRVWPANLMTTLRINPSTIAQAIPKGRTHQGMWLSANVRWYRRMLERGPSGDNGLAHPGHYVEWAARNLSGFGSNTRLDGYGPEDLADMAIALGRGFNTRWTLAQAARACAEYHAGLHAAGAALAAQQNAAVRDAMMYGVGAHRVVIDEAGPVPAAMWGRNVPSPVRTAEFDKPVDYAPWPLEWIGKTDLACKIVALDTPRKLYEEGVAMDHCVFDYWANVWGGASRIFSIRSLVYDGSVLPKGEGVTTVNIGASPYETYAVLGDGGRIATFELRPHGAVGSLTKVHGYWTVSQIQGPGGSGARGKRVPGAAQAIGVFLDAVLDKVRAGNVPD